VRSWLLGGFSVILASKMHPVGCLDTGLYRNV